MCAVSEQVIFSDPFLPSAPLNRHTTPHLDTIVACLREDAELVLAAAALKSRFLSCTQALLHGDLHTGSVMVMEGSTFVIDPEFAFYGPMGFDVGFLLANFLFSYFSQDPDQSSHDGDFASLLLDQTEKWYTAFESHFTAQFMKFSTGEGEFFTGGVNSSPSTLAAALKACLAEIWSDALGYAGLELIRRILGISHVADLEEIADPLIRSRCEKKCLLMARCLVCSAGNGIALSASASIRDIHRLKAVAEKIRSLSAQTLDGMVDWQLQWKVLTVL